nr:dicer-2 [Scaphoideus titanus]
MAESKKDDDNKIDFAARDYQVRLAEMAIERNKIIYLPTGSGKTYISIMIISHFLQQNDCASKKIGQGGKRAFFLVNTVALVHQQKQQIKRTVSFDVQGYSGDMGVDHWCKSVWDKELNEFKILVMTSQIFLNMLLSNIITLKDVAVIVFDECHHGVENHPMRQIMMQFHCTPEREQPRVVGLTATLLNKNLAVDKVIVEIKTLENTYLSQIATADDENMVKLYSTNPKELKVDYLKNNTKLGAYVVRDQLFDRWTTSIQPLKIDDSNQADKSIKPDGAVQIEDRSKKTNKELKNVIEDIKVNMDDLGLYGGNVAVLARLIQLQKLIYNCESEASKTVFSILSSKLSQLRKYFENEMGNLTEYEKIRRHSSDKVIQLFKILRTIKEGDQAIVFVRRRYTAKIMHRIVSTAASVDPKLKHIKCDFVVGYNVANPFKDTRENLLQRNYNSRVLEKFNSGMLNVLFGSNVVEEGMDVSKCNMVIMFDLPMDFRAYLQSKGRARHSHSRYIILNCDPKFIERHQRFTAIENRLQELLCGGQYKKRLESTKEEIDASLFASIPGLEPYKPMGNDGPSITALSAISYINRYFANLKTDKFTRITPYWFIKAVGTKTQCFLHLPMESKVSGLIPGTLQNNKENAKRSVALEACKVLHKHGELDDKHLLPISIESRTVDCNSFMPNWDSEERFFEETNDGKKINLGTKNNKRAWIKKWPECLTGCFPSAKTQVYLHVLELKVIHQPSQDNHKLMAFYQTLSEPVTYAIISAKQLPKLAPFPLYMSTGELEVNILKGKTCSFNEDELIKINIFHSQIFDKVLGVVKSFLIRDYSNRQNSYLIAPVAIGDSTVDIDWNMIEKINRPFPNPEVKPTDESRKSLVINEENYLGMMVTPWYRTVPAQKYIVTKVRHDMDENTPFPSDSYETYRDYFTDKYGIFPLIHQPLLEVRPLSSKMNNLKPKALTKALKHKNKDENEDFDVWLLPEFCYVYPVPGRYWIKAQLLPSLLHRIAQLCTAEELRVRLVRDTSIGLAKFPPGQKLKKLEADASLVKHIPVETTQLLTPLSLQLETRCSLTPNTNFNIWEVEEEPTDIDRNMDAPLFDIFYYEQFVNESLSSESPKGNKFNVIPSKQEPKFVDPPPLNMLKRKAEGLGPDQVQILQAITAAVAGDFINCERLETLGDSFLKFAISMVLHEKEKDLQEGVLTNIKGQIVGNKNLYFCGKSKNLGNILQVRHFLPCEEWIPPNFCVEHSVQQTIVTACLEPSCLYSITIPEEEVLAGRISKATRKRFTEILFEAEELKYKQTCTFTNTLALSDKNVSDAVEAIIGVYLENSGVLGALRVMNWFQVIKPSLATEEVFTTTLTTPEKGLVGTPMDHLLQPCRLEEILNYKFNNKAYMLQALSHPSYHQNNITQCYQRLEFLGDAIIDFLITVHIFERCTELPPGDLTDLRSALVNNITLACITVRHGLHRFLLHRSSSLNDIMTRFVRHQEERQHKIDNDILFLFEECETNIAEAIEVPKVLGDVFEALIGAIYLDSGKDLFVTWRIIYNLMKGEIEKFHLDVPKNHVRMLYESKCTPNFSSSITTDGVVMVSVEVYHEGKIIICDGFGDNKRQAKRAAAKMALRKIRGSLVK